MNCNICNDKLINTSRGIQQSTHVKTINIRLLGSTAKLLLLPYIFSSHDNGIGSFFEAITNSFE
jgi:hypothetical protein